MKRNEKIVRRAVGRVLIAMYNERAQAAREEQQKRHYELGEAGPKLTLDDYEHPPIPKRKLIPLVVRVALVALCAEAQWAKLYRLSKVQAESKADAAASWDAALGEHNVPATA